MTDNRIRGHSSTAADGGECKILRLKILGGLHLAKKDIFGLSDPYTRVTVYRGHRDTGMVDRFKTRTIQRTLNPSWNDEFLVRVNPLEDKLLLEVFDENRMTRDDFLGQVELNLGTVQVERSARRRPKDFILKPRSARSRVRGSLRMSVGFVVQEEQERLGRSEEGEDAEAENTWTMVNRDEGAPGTSPMPYSLHPAVVGAMRADPDNESLAESLSSAAAVVAEPQEPLMPDWEERADPQSTRVYYVNHTNRTTQWERPTVENALPPGWEEKEDANGRVYYIDHNSHNTTWSRPTHQTSVDEERARTQQAQNRYLSRRAVSYDTNPITDLAGSFEMIDVDGREHPAEVTPTRPPRRRNREGRRSEQREQDEVVIQTASPSAPAVRHQVSVTSSEEPLPPGWAMAEAPNNRVFYIDHSTMQTTWEDPRKQDTVSTTPEVTGLVSNEPDLTKDLGPLPPGWEERVHVDGRVFYIDHTTRLTSWEDPRLKVLGGQAVQISHDYKRKYDLFRSRLKRPNNVPNKFDIPVRRDNIFEDSYHHVMNVKKVDFLKTRLWIEFQGETGLDYGGVSREWFFLLSREMFNPYYGLFEYSAADNYTLQINPQSGIANERHLSYFTFIGRIAGMAVYHGRLLDGFFIRPFYKMMIGKVITLTDMESVDSEYSQSLLWIKENDPEVLDLTFSVDQEAFGEVQEIELKPMGRDIPVTEENKLEYIGLVIKWRFVDRIKQQMDAFMGGFTELVPRDLLKPFDENEIELLMCGMQDVDVQDWKQNTIYRGEYNPNHPTIVLFWRAVYSFNNETRTKLLQFVTGTSRVPMNGFKELYGSNGPQLFTIDKWGNPEQLPRAHTCFNRIDLPPYTSFDDMRRKLLLAVENAAGFEGVD